MLIDLATYKDERGRLTAVDSSPFQPKRVFWAHRFHRERGGHAHLSCEQLMVAICGTVTVTLEKDGAAETITLDRPDQGLYIEPGTFVRYIGDRDAVCLVLASECYDRADIVKGESE